MEKNKRYLTELLQDDTFVEDLNYIDNIKYQQKRMDAYIGYMGLKYSLTKEDIQKTYFLNTIINGYNKDKDL